MSTQDTRRALAGALMMAAVLLVVSWSAGPAGGDRTGTSRRPILRPPPTPEPLVPTALPGYRPTLTPRTLPAPTAVPTYVPTLAPRASPVSTAVPTQLPTSTPAISPTPIASAPVADQAVSLAQKTPGAARDRICVGVPVGQLSDYDWGEGWPGWYLNWRIVRDPPQPHGARFAQMVYTSGDSFAPSSLDAIKTTAGANPGALWLIGNEPDVAWQGNATPEQYAGTYGVLYRVIKEADPTAQVAIAGVSQPTPLRLAYLERVLAAYRQQYGEAMPVDAWNVHAFILREERDSWGVGIPPGMTENQGRLYEIGDHADMGIFEQQIVDFRRWMADHGFRDKPLIVSEYGILMPESYGFPPEVVSQFMVDTFDYFLTARDEVTGLRADDNRLVQAFCWYSAADTADRYPTSNLFDPETRQATPLGEIFKAYVAALR